MTELSSKYPSMISHIVYKPKTAPKVEAAIATANADTNTDPQKMINVINTEKKKKPHNITIKNYNPNEPKVYPNMKYTEKQNYRRYKTKTEPKLYSRIMIDEEDDIINTIKKAFGIEKENKRNISNVETSGADYVKDPEPIGVEQTEPPKYITQVAKGSQNDTNTEYDFDEFERELMSFEYEDGADIEKMLFIDDTPPRTPPGSTKGLSISTEITSAVASPALKTPEARAAELNKSKELDAEINAILETEEELKKRLFKGLKTEKEKEEAWDKHFRDLRIKEEQEEYKKVTAGLEVGAAGNAWTKYKKDKEVERLRIMKEKLDKYNEEQYQKKEILRKRQETIKRKTDEFKPSLRTKEKQYGKSNPHKKTKDPINYYDNYGIPYIW